MGSGWTRCGHSEQQEWKECRLAKGIFQQENQGMGNKVQFYTALFARIWEYRAEAVAAFQGGAGICSFPN